MDYLPYRRTNRVKLFFIILISVDLAQYEILRAKVCDFKQVWYKHIFTPHTEDDIKEWTGMDFAVSTKAALNRNR